MASKPHIPKPIFLVKFPLEAASRLLSNYEFLEKKLGEDYHVLVAVAPDSDELKCEVYNTKEGTEADLEQLKLEIKESFRNLQITETIE